VDTIPPPTAHNEVVLDELERIVRWSKEFTLAFVKCNHALQCDVMKRALLDRLQDMRIVTVELDGPVISVLAELKKHWDVANPPDAVCLCGLEKSIDARREAAPVLGRLNHDRDLLRRSLSGALLIWLPDFALDLIARGSPDFWAWRSGVYEFPTHAELWQQDSRVALSGESGAVISLPVEEKEKEIARIEVLLRTARALPQQDRRSQITIAQLLLKLGTLHYALGDLSAAKECYAESLGISRRIEEAGIEALSLHRLGMIAQDQGDLTEAERLYETSLEMEKKLGNEGNVSGCLHQLGILAQEQGDWTKARRLYEESLEIEKKLGLQGQVASTLHQLGILAQEQGDLTEARRLYQESLEIEKKLGNESGVGASLHQLGNVSYLQGDLAEAQRLYQESLQIRKRLGDQNGMALNLTQLGQIAEIQRKQIEASELFRGALRIFEKLRSPNAEIARRALARLESQRAP
jgi:tetratricopeptide (TPR) repeat protein